ncbi:MAG: carboxypeptidase-like regulatory domain-containing protein [Bacteroidota bacterium]
MRTMIRILPIIILLSAIFVQSCKKEDPILPFKGAPNIGEPKTLETLSGIVVDEFGNPMPGVTVKAHGQVYTTTTSGFFIFYNVLTPYGRYVVHFSIDGYFSTTRSEVVIDNTPATLAVQLLPIDVTVISDTASFLSGEGGQLTIGTILTLNFPPDNFVYESGLPYTGTVHVAGLYFDPTDPLYNLRVPGGDQMGIDIYDNDITLRAFVGAGIELFDDNGEKLNLNQNMRSSVTFNVEIPAGLLAVAPSDIEVWTFDEDFGLRLSSAGSGSSNTAQKNGSQYQGALGHFSFFGCEVAYNLTSTVQGTVTDANGIPISGVYVSVGESYALTNQNGHYERTVPSGVTIDVQIDYYGVPVFGGTVTPYGNTVVDMQVPVLDIVTGTLVDCNGNPVPGHVIITTGANEIASTYTTTGNFTMVAPSTPFDIYAYGNNGHFDLMFFTPPGFPYNFGNITLCPPPQVGLNYITLTGGPMMYSGYNHSFINFFDGYYFNSPPYYTSCTPATAIGTDYMAISFLGQTTGTFAIDGSDYYVDAIIPSGGFLLENGTLIVSRYDAVGGLIEGSFSGVSTDGTQVDGHFSVIRKPDN